jgi:hypothetical protein
MKINRCKKGNMGDLNLNSADTTFYVLLFTEKEVVMPHARLNSSVCV